MMSDFRDLLQAFNNHDVAYLIVGAHAMAVHGHVRATKDLDIWVRADESNAPRIMRALRAFGAPVHDVVEADFCAPGIVLQLGAGGGSVRIDILTAIDGVDFEDAWRERVLATLENQPVAALSKKHLIQNKKAVGRTRDLADVEQLEK